MANRINERHVARGRPFATDKISAVYDGFEGGGVSVKEEEVSGEDDLLVM